MNLCAAIDTRRGCRCLSYGGIYSIHYIYITYMYIYQAGPFWDTQFAVSVCAACKWILNTFPQWIVFFCARSLALSSPSLSPLCLRAREFPFKHRTLMENLVYTNSLQPTINRICNYNSRPHILHTYIYIQYTTIYVYVIYDGIFWLFIAYTIIALAPSLPPPQTDSIFRELSSCPFFRKTIFQTAPDKWFVRRQFLRVSI